MRGAQGWQTQVNGSHKAITYSFMTQAPISGGEGGTGFVAFNSQQQQILRDVLYVMQQQTGLSFAEVAGDGGQLVSVSINKLTRAVIRICQMPSKVMPALAMFGWMWKQAMS